jgi:hypothetical protein
MTNQFLTKDQVEVNKAGYLVKKGETTPIYNEEFVNLQKAAEYVVLFAEMSKTKDFVGKKADNFEAFGEEVTKQFNLQNKKEYISKPTRPKTELTSKLQKEALSFISFKEEESKIDKINEYLERFSLLFDFEEFGLYFNDSEIVKLNKIYTTEEIKTAITISSELVK